MQSASEFVKNLGGVGRGKEKEWLHYISRCFIKLCDHSLFLKAR